MKNKDSTTAGKPFHSVIRLRAFIAAMIIIPADNYWVLMMEKVRTGPYPTTISIFANVVFILAVLMLINSGLKRINPKLAFSSAEMLLIYTMAAIGAALAGHDMLPTLVGMLTYPWQFATPENLWSKTFMPFLPKTLSVSDPGAVKGLWEGNSSLYSTGYWRFWVLPVVNWTAFVTVLVFVMMCINTLVRKQWTDRERLTFPVVQLPIAMTEPKGDIWRSRLFWLAFSISSFIVFINGLNVYLPMIPKIAVGFEGHDLTSGLATKPWSSLGWTPYSFYPFAIGLGYLLPADLSFSCWFFYLFWKLEKLMTAMMGWDAIPGFPYDKHQAYGGVIAIVLTLLWTSRPYLKQVWLKILERESELDDSQEPLSYRSAAVGALLGLGFLTVFMMRIGMSPLVTIIAFGMYFLLATAIARIRAELGPPIHDFHFSGPDAMMTQSAGIGRFSNGDFVGFTYLWWFNRAFRSHPMPIGIEGMKMADSAKASQKRFLWGVVIAAAVGTVATFWAYLDVGYRLGFSAGVRQGGVYAASGFHNLEQWWSRPEEAMGPDWGANIAMVCGFLFCMLLSYARLHIFGFPFHPIGYAVSASYQINLVWMPLLIAWTIKVSILRFGGLKLYRSVIPFFLGLILGEMVMGCIWSLIGIIWGIPYYNFWGE